MTETGSIAERPLVTFALFAYNQERFIREAVESALSQDYSPLQIILSDDCSGDRTFEIMQETVTAYEGPHHIVLNRNKQNLGIGGHVKRLAEMAEGDIIVMAAGDDVSFPHRTSKITQLFDHTNDTKAVFSRSIIINECGEPVIPDRKTTQYPKLLNHFELAKRGGGIGSGSTYAYHRDCFYWPYAYPSAIVSEDRLLPFRAALLGNVAYIDEALIKYRILNTSISNASDFVASRNCNLHSSELIRTTEFAKIDNMINTYDYNKLLYIIKKVNTTYESLSRLNSNKSISSLYLYKIRYSIYHNGYAKTATRLFNNTMKIIHIKLNGIIK